MDDHSYRSSKAALRHSLSGQAFAPPRQHGYPSPFRGQVCRAHVPSHVSRRWLSPRGASLPSLGSRRARFPALCGTMKALRLPIRVSTVAYLFRFRSPRAPPSFVLASALPDGSEVPSGPGAFADAGRPILRLARAWTRMGSLRSSGDPSRAFAAFQDPGRTNVLSPLSITSVLPPLTGQRRLQQIAFRG